MSASPMPSTPLTRDHTARCRVLSRADSRTFGACVLAGHRLVLTSQTRVNITQEDTDGT